MRGNEGDGRYAELALETLHRLDTAFDTGRSASLDELMPSIFQVLTDVLAGSHWFVAFEAPDYPPGEQESYLPFRRRVFCSSDDASLAAAASPLVAGRKFRRPASDGELELASRYRLGELPYEAGALHLDLVQRGQVIGVLGVLASGPGDMEASTVLAAAARRIDTELDLLVTRLVRRCLARKINHALEDYYLERGVDAAMKVLLDNGVCEAAFLFYDRSGLESEADLVNCYYTTSGRQPVDITSEEVRAFVEDPTRMPLVVEETLSRHGQGITHPLQKRAFGDRARTFGIVVFLGEYFDHSRSLFLAETVDDLDSAMINYHEKRRELSRFLSPAVVSRLLEGDREEVERQLAPKQQLIAMGFADIVGYSSICSRHPGLPQQIAHLLRDWKQRMRELTFRHGGIVDKFIGDCLFFHRGPWSSDSPSRLALDALRIGLDCVAATRELDARLAEYGLGAGERLGVSVGLHIGNDLVVGDIGGEFTAIGADVNITQRIQGHEACSGRLLVSAALEELAEPHLAELGVSARFGERLELELKGVGAFAVYELMLSNS